MGLNIDSMGKIMAVDLTYVPPEERPWHRANRREERLVTQNPDPDNPRYIARDSGLQARQFARNRYLELRGPIPMPRIPITWRGNPIVVRNGRVLWPLRTRRRNRIGVRIRANYTIRRGATYRRRTRQHLATIRRRGRRIRRSRRRMTYKQGGQTRLKTNNVRITPFKRRTKRIRIRRIRRKRLVKHYKYGWYSKGIHYLTGNGYDPRYSDNTEQARNSFGGTYKAIYLDTANGDWDPVGYLDKVYYSGMTGTGLGNTWMNSSLICFNYWVSNGAQLASQNTGLNGETGINFVGQNQRTVAPWVGKGWTQFFYGNTIENGLLPETWTNQHQLVLMPDVPLQQVQWATGRAGAPGQTSTQTNVSTTQAIPYSVKWSYVYARFRYSIRVAWPDIYAKMGSLTQTAAPNNPPLVVRLFAIRYMTEDAPSAEALPNYIFPVNAGIRSGFSPTYRKKLWENWQGVMIFSKTFTFNGALLPNGARHAPGDNVDGLVDGQDGVFTIRYPYKTHNNYVMGSSTATSNDIVYWPSVKQGKVVTYCYAAFDGDPYLWRNGTTDLSNKDSNDVAVEIEPKASIVFSPLYFCFPRYKKPDPHLSTTGYYENTYGQLSAMRTATIMRNPALKASMLLSNEIIADEKAVSDVISNAKIQNAIAKETEKDVTEENTCVLNALQSEAALEEEDEEAGPASSSSAS